MEPNVEVSVEQIEQGKTTDVDLPDIAEPRDDQSAPIGAEAACSAFGSAGRSTARHLLAG